MLTTLFPNYQWLPWKFHNIPHGFWKDLKNQRNFMEYLSQQLNIKNNEDWYKITTKV